MNITMLVTNAYHPDPRVHKEAVHLVSLGHQVSVLCWDRHQEYLEAQQVELDGVNLVRFPIKSTLGSGLKQLPAYWNYSQACGAWMKAHPVDAIHAHDLDGMLVAVRQRPRQVPITFDMHEYFEYTRKVTDLTRPLVRWLVNRMTAKANAIVYVHDIQLEHLSKAAQAKAIFIPNYPEEASYLPSTKVPSKRLRVGYIGKIRQFEQLKNLIEATADLPIDLHFHGDGIHYQHVLDVAKAYPHVTMTGRFSSAEVGDLYRHIDLLYVAYDTKVVQYRRVEPVKFYEAVLTQTPILVEGTMDVARWAIDAGFGFAIDGTSVTSIHQVISDLVNHPQKLQHAQAVLAPLSQRYRWSDVVSRLDALYPLL